jgi:DNA-binding NtrC family response regulator
VLVVQPDPTHLLDVLGALSSIGLDVTVAESFKDARDSLDRQQPLLLLTALRLQDYNGLHLFIRGRSSWPTIPAVITSEIADPVLQEETERLGATFMLMPAPHGEIVAAVCRTLFRPVTSHVPPEPVRAPFERRRADRRSSQASPVSPERRRANRRRTPGDRLAELSLG